MQVITLEKIINGILKFRNCDKIYKEEVISCAHA